SKSIEIDPNPSTYHNRGCLNYDARQYESALADFRKEIDLNPSSTYAHFRVCLIRTRLGEGPSARAELNAYLSGPNMPKSDPWALQIGRFLTGQLPEPGFLAEAKNSGEKLDAAHSCEAYFYAGSMRLFNGDKATAVDYFRKAVATNAKTFTEYASAVAELRSLEAQQ
ncbi:MAG TPA: hypothetical protein VN281_05030, partial [Verrucomicrobiae bacterium]|nr:hypothetical protein [Verrucomicrobiae bacterium]